MSFALFLAKNLDLSVGEEFCTFLTKNLHLSFSSLDWRWVHTQSVAKNVALFETLRILCKIRTSNGLTGVQSRKTNDQISGCIVLLLIEKKWIKLIPKTIGNRKRDCAWGCARGINTTWENLQIKKHKSGRRSFRWPDWFVLFDLRIFSGGVYPPSATSRTISFSISNSFWY